ncbi:arabinosyltransferase domain-containing protein [Amycolatopsis sp. lyj-108]|uniref:arabinosyltransferase domain-containing protein n=1 Tax=Amycolatopsis sp. lyj-108 TaxID=2789286 RepID=UPI00397AC691
MPAAGQVTRRGARYRVVAGSTGLLAVLVTLTVPFLPVSQATTTVTWPTAYGTRAVNAPLTSYSPTRLDATIGCATARALDSRMSGPGTLLSTTPPASPLGAIAGLALSVDNGLLIVRPRGEPQTFVPLPGGDCDITVTATAAATLTSIGGSPVAVVSGDHRPQLTGIYSDIDGAQDGVRGLSVRAEVDNRFDTSPSPMKLIAIALAITLTGCAVLALRGIDGRGRRPSRHRRRPGKADLVVTAALTAWWVIGTRTPDDGYILTMVRDRVNAGYLPNFYRWFGAPDSFFGWFYEGYALLTRLSEAGPVLRLPSLIMGVGTWLVIDHVLLPRLGARTRGGASRWACAAMFLAFWLPYNDGLRAEPVILFFTALVYGAVERAIATRRPLPVALAALCAGPALAASPTGLLATLPFLVGARPLLRLVRERVRVRGFVAVAPPIAAAATVIGTVVFWDQSWRSLADATRLHFDLGPAFGWYEDHLRYADLLSDSVAGSVAYRLPVLLTIVSLVVCAVLLIRRRRLAGLATAPLRRLLGLTVGTFAVLALAPTKISHQFGILALAGPLLAAAMTRTWAPPVTRTRRDAALVATAVLLAAALALSGPNTAWYVSGWGFPLADGAPAVGPIPLRTVAVILACAAAAVVVVEHLRGRPSAARTRSRTAPALLVSTTMVLAHFTSAGVAIGRQHDSYSPGADNFERLVGRGGCGLADDVLVETDPSIGSLTPADGEQARAPWADAGGGLAGTPWYALPATASNGELPVVLPIPAGNTGDLTVEFGHRGPGGPSVTRRSVAAGIPEVRVPVDGDAVGADRIRFLAPAASITGANGVPRVPRVRTLTEVVADAPTYIDWPAAFPFPCLDVIGPRSGIGRLPRFRIDGDATFRYSGWSCAEKGGPAGWLDVVGGRRTLTTYLRGRPTTDWGQLQVIEPYAPEALPSDAAVSTAPSRTVPGTWSPGPLPRTVTPPPGPSTSDGPDGFLCFG